MGPPLVQSPQKLQMHLAQALAQVLAPRPIRAASASHRSAGRCVPNALTPLEQTYCAAGSVTVLLQHEQIRLPQRARLPAVRFDSQQPQSWRQATRLNLQLLQPRKYSPY